MSLPSLGMRDDTRVKWGHASCWLAKVTLSFMTRLFGYVLVKKCCKALSHIHFLFLRVILGSCGVDWLIGLLFTETANY